MNCPPHESHPTGSRSSGCQYPVFEMSSLCNWAVKPRRVCFSSEVVRGGARCFDDKSMISFRPLADTTPDNSQYPRSMLSLLPSSRSYRFLGRFAAILLSLGAIYLVPPLNAQNTPLISGGLGFFSRTEGGNTSYSPILAPLIAVPAGPRLLFESRATLLESFSPQGGGKGYTTSHFIGISYAQADYVFSKHVTAVGGYFLIPFGTYNERLTPIWIANLQDGPLIYGLGNMNTGSGAGGQLRGSIVSRDNFSLNYAAYFAANVTNEQILSSRSTGGQLNAYLPKARLEVGTSYGRLLDHPQTNAIGTHVWWEPASVPFQLRSEYAHGPHSQGYWVETAYRLSQFNGPDSVIGRLEPIFRIQQAFRNSPSSTDGLPGVDTQRVDFGLDYHLPHEVRINTSYARQFASTGNTNIWETALVYRFLFPAWRGK
jgi:hypothetical protein